MATPLVSVIVPAYNAARSIGETIESALGQTHTRREIIVVDDGSTDATAARLEPYGPSIHYVRQDHREVGAARNTGLRRASGDYIAFLDADDLWDSRTLEIQVEVAARHPASGLVVCDGVEFEGERILSSRLLEGAPARLVESSPAGEVTRRFYREIIQQNPISCPAQGLIPRAVADRVGLVSEIPAESEDWDYTLRIARAYPITFHRRSLVRWRYSPSSRSGPRDLRDLRWALREIRTLERHLRQGLVDDRELVRRTLDRRVSGQARRAYDHGRAHDIDFARAHLREIRGAAPGHAVPLLYLLALRLPETLVASVLRIRDYARSRTLR